MKTIRKSSSLMNLFLVLVFLTLTSCEKEKDKQNTLSADKTTISFEAEGGHSSFTIQNDASEWSIENPAPEWINLSTNSGKSTVGLVTVSVHEKRVTARTAELTISSGNAPPIKITISQKASDFLYELTSDIKTINFLRGGNSANIVINSTSPSWTISSEVEWLTFDKSEGTSGRTSVKVTAIENLGSELRNATININAEHTEGVTIATSQKGDYYPNYNPSPLPPNADGMSSNAVELAAKMQIGWNIGNTLEAIGGETAWGNPKVTRELIKLVKASGFDAIRIPCSWDQNLSSQASGKIKDEWLYRVKQVVEYCVQEDLLVVLNIHWDGGWLENNCTTDKQEAVNAKQKALWEQIATYFRDFDEHLMFASANEPNVENAAQMAVLTSYHQTFVDAVRSTGGRNSYRVLVIQGPGTDIEKTNQLMKTLPNDEIANRFISEIHYYTPWNLTGMEKDESWGNRFYYWGNGFHSATDPDHNATWGEEAEMEAFFKLMKNQFVDKGIPVIMGEYGYGPRKNLTGDDLALHLASRAYYLKTLNKSAKANGIIPFFWDIGHQGLFNRNTNKVNDQIALDAILAGISE